MKRIPFGKSKNGWILLAVILALAAAVSTGGSTIARQLRPSIQLNGTVTDAMCGRTHKAKAENESDAECARECARLAGYALVVGQRLYLLQGDQVELSKFAADQVLVTGKVIGHDVVAVESVTPWVVEVSCHTQAGEEVRNCK